MFSTFLKHKQTISHNLSIVRVSLFASLWVTSLAVADFDTADSSALSSIAQKVGSFQPINAAEMGGVLDSRLLVLMNQAHPTDLYAILKALQDLRAASTNGVGQIDYSGSLSDIKTTLDTLATSDDVTDIIRRINANTTGDVQNTASIVSAIQLLPAAFQQSTESWIQSYATVLAALRGTGNTSLTDILNAIRNNGGGSGSSADYSSIISAINNVNSTILNHEGTDLQNVEAHQQTIIDLLDGLLGYLVPEDGPGIEPVQNSMAEQFKQAIDNSSRIYHLVDNSDLSLADLDLIQSDVRRLRTGFQSYANEALGTLSAIQSNVGSLTEDVGTISDSLTDFSTEFENRFPENYGSRVIEETEGSRLLLDTIDKNVQNIVANQSIHEKNLFANLYPYVQSLRYLAPLANDTRAMRNWFQLYFGDGELGTLVHTNYAFHVTTNELNGAISTNAPSGPPDGTNAVPKMLAGIDRPLLFASGINTNGVGGGGASTVDKHGAFYDFVVGTNALFRKYAQSLDLVATNSNYVLSNQLTQIFFQSNIWVAVNSITNMLATNQLEALTMMVSNAFPWSYAITYDEIEQIHPDGMPESDNEPYSLPEFLSYLTIPHFSMNGTYPFDVLFGSGYESMGYFPVTNGLYLLGTRDKEYFLGSESGGSFDYGTTLDSELGIKSIFDYQTWLQASMRDSLALLSYGILDSITNSVEGQMEEFNSDDVETPTSDDLTTFQNDGKEGIEGVKDTLRTSLDSLTGASNTSGEPEIVIDLASVPGLNERIEVNLNQAAGDVKDTAHTLFVWLWRVFMFCYFVQLAAHEYDWWISLGKSQPAFKNGAS